MLHWNIFSMPWFSMLSSSLYFDAKVLPQTVQVILLLGKPSMKLTSFSLLLFPWLFNSVSSLVTSLFSLSSSLTSFSSVLTSFSSSVTDFSSSLIVFSSIWRLFRVTFFYAIFSEIYFYFATIFYCCFQVSRSPANLILFHMYDRR